MQDSRRPMMRPVSEVEGGAVMTPETRGERMALGFT